MIEVRRRKSPLGVAGEMSWEGNWADTPRNGTGADSWPVECFM